MTPFLTAAIAEMLPDAGASESCAECGFSWRTDGAQALAHIEDAADRFADRLQGDEAVSTSARQGWSPAAYVWHVGDVIRAWAERLHSLGVDPDAGWAGFDPDELGRARSYEALPPTTAPWALARSTDALRQSLTPLQFDGAFLHPEWGRGTVADALRWLAHEVVHHDLDVRRGLGQV